MRWNKYLKIIGIIPVFVIAYFIYDAIFPSEIFYKEEFKIATKKDFPTNGEFIFKSASFPDLHGSYYSIFCIETNESFYNDLYNDLHIIADTIVTTPMHEFEKGVKRIEGKELVEKISFTVGHVYYNIGFFPDRKTILVYRVSY